MKINGDCNLNLKSTGINKECGKPIHIEPSKKYIDRYYAEYNYLNKHNLLFEEVTNHLEFKAFRLLN